MSRILVGMGRCNLKLDRNRKDKISILNSECSFLTMDKDWGYKGSHNDFNFVGSGSNLGSS